MMCGVVRVAVNPNAALRACYNSLFVHKSIRSEREARAVALRCAAPRARSFRRTEQPPAERTVVRFIAVGSAEDRASIPAHSGYYTTGPELDFRRRAGRPTTIGRTVPARRAPDRTASPDVAHAKGQWPTRPIQRGCAGVLAVGGACT